MILTTVQIWFDLYKAALHGASGALPEYAARYAVEVADAALKQMGPEKIKALTSGEEEAVLST